MLIWQDFIVFAKTTLPSDSILLSILAQLKISQQSQQSITLVCPSTGVKFYVDKKKQEIENLIETFTQRQYKITLTALEKKIKPESVLKDAPLIDYQTNIDSILLKNGFQPKYSFSSFAVSSSNQIAFAAAQAVAENPGKIYNPLFLYGGVGVGKTHLAQAIGQATINRMGIGFKALFSPGDDFTNELIEAIRFKKTSQFRQKYRKIDLLIVDDIQFIAGKNSIQEEFFHTFNSIISNGGQIILTSDRPPSEIKDVEDRLRSRFAGGLTLDIQPPDMELRSAILLIKASEKNINISLEAVQLLAEAITDTRSLEGTLVSLSAKVLISKNQIEREDIERFLNQNQEKDNTKIQKKLTESQIIKTVCLFYDVKQTQIKTPLRSEKIAIARQVIMYLLRQLLNLKLEAIAKTLKRKDHTTIIHGCEKIKTLMMKNPQFKKEIDTIIQSL